MTDTDDELDAAIRERVRRQLADAKRRDAAKRARRRELETARKFGLVARRRQRLANIEKGATP
jgi:hypothetical protein